MRYIGPAILACLICLPLLWSKDLPPDTLKRKDEILKLFADEFIPLTPGKGKFPAEFVMGSDQGPANEKPAHKVTCKYDFAAAKYEVTQELYFVIMGDNPSKWKGPRNSVEMINHADAKKFCAKVTEELRKLKLLKDKEVIRLPTEAEWEYFARAGTTTAWSFGDDEKEIGKYAWYKVNAPGNDPPVGKKLGNPWGLFDIHGYVGEWVEDTYQDTYEKAPADGRAWIVDESKERVVRGGSFADPADQVRSAYREHRPADFKSDKIGFRCVRVKS